MPSPLVLGDTINLADIADDHQLGDMNLTGAITCVDLCALAVSVQRFRAIGPWQTLT
jgi:hypothetical protein